MVEISQVLIPAERSQQVEEVGRNLTHGHKVTKGTGRGRREAEERERDVPREKEGEKETETKEEEAKKKRTIPRVRTKA